MRQTCLTGVKGLHAQFRPKSIVFLPGNARLAANIALVR